jgi:ppGpp synthetase/RelA/SpoT-type nucleotidyltranferase
LEDIAKWYIQNRPVYESLLEAVTSIIESLLKRESTVRYYLVQSRVKEYNSFVAKLPKGIEDKKYAQPKDMTDFAALRVICYLRQDKEIVAGLLHDNFRVIKREDKSLDKGVDKIGYNAIHLDAMLKDDRATLPEHQRYKGLKFEIQITTILQHIYAQIGHDLLYKPNNVLPYEIQDSINKTSAELEGLDEKFERIMWNVDDYRKDLDVPIDEPSLRKYLLRNFGDILDFKTEYGSVRDTYVVDQLHSLGIYTFAEFEKIIPPNFKERYRKISPDKHGTYVTGLAVWFLIIHDHKKYFEEAYKPIYGVFNSHDYRLFEEFGVNISELPSDIFDCD